MLRIGRHIDQPAEFAHGRSARYALDVGLAAAVGHVVVRAEPDHAMLLPCGEEHPAKPVFGIPAVEVDCIGNVSARKLYRRHMAPAAGRLPDRDFGKRLGQEQLRHFESGVLRQHDVERRHAGPGVHDDKLRRSPRGDFDTHMPGVDRGIGDLSGPGKAERLALCRAEPADYIEQRRHSL